MNVMPDKLLDISFSVIGIFVGLIAILVGLIAACFTALVAYAFGLQNLWRSKRDREKELDDLKEEIAKNRRSLISLNRDTQDEFAKFRAQLTDETRDLLLQMPDTVRKILGRVHFDDFLKKVEDPATQPTIFDFWEKSTESQRQAILIEEPRILAWSMLDSADTRPEFCNAYWLLGVFYASMSYNKTNGKFQDTSDVRRGIAYLERAKLLDPTNDRPVDDLGLLLYSLDTPDKSSYVDQAIQLLSSLIDSRLREGKPALQRAICNLAWAYMEMGRSKPDQLGAYLDKASALVADDAVLEYPFRIPGRSDPGIVLTVRACILAHKSKLLDPGPSRTALLSEAMNDMERAERNALPSVERVLSEETINESGDLWPLVDSEFGPRLESLKARIAAKSRGY